MDPVRAASASGGLQYTPPSYLLRASDTTNRPWNYNGSSANNNEGDFYGNSNNRNNGGDESSENEYDLPQEQRPQTRRESYVDAHFHQRVRTKQSRYRDIITGAEEIETTETETTTETTERSERTTSSKKPNSLKLRSVSEPSNIDAETVRNLRAHRLRSSLLKPTSEDYDLQTKLELRRLKARKNDAEQSERAERASLVASDERMALENERKAIQEERKALKLAKEEATYALKRASQINDERRKQRELDAIIEMNRLEDEKITKRREQQRSRSRRRSSSRNNKNNRSSMKTKSFNNNDNDDDFTLFDLDNDFAFLNDISGIVRDSSLMKGCLSVTTGCFGSTSTCNDLSSDTLKEDTIIDNTPDLIRCSDTSHSDIEDGDENNIGGENGIIIGEGFGNSNQNETNNGSSLRRSRLSAQYRV